MRPGNWPSKMPGDWLIHPTLWDLATDLRKF